MEIVTWVRLPLLPAPALSGLETFSTGDGYTAREPNRVYKSMPVSGDRRVSPFPKETEAMRSAKRGASKAERERNSHADNGSTGKKDHEAARNHKFDCISK